MDYLLFYFMDFNFLNIKSKILDILLIKKMIILYIIVNTFQFSVKFIYYIIWKEAYLEARRWFMLHPICDATFCLFYVTGKLRFLSKLNRREGSYFSVILSHEIASLVKASG